jgi:hypothetical protein
MTAVVGSFFLVWILYVVVFCVYFAILPIIWVRVGLLGRFLGL